MVVLLKSSTISAGWLQKVRDLGRMFTLDVNMPEVKAAMFAHGSRVVADTHIWHKIIGHVNMQRLKLMQSKKIVIGLPKFKVHGMHKICEACQLGKVRQIMHFHMIEM